MLIDVSGAKSLDTVQDTGIPRLPEVSIGFDFAALGTLLLPSWVTLAQAPFSYLESRG